LPFLKPVSQITWIQPGENSGTALSGEPEKKQERLLAGADAFIKGSLLTSRRIEDALESNTIADILRPVTPQSLLLSNTTRLISSGQIHLQALAKGEKTLSEATGAFSGDAVGGLLASCALTLSKEATTLALGRLGLPDCTVVAAGLFAGLTSDQVTQWAFENGGAKKQIETVTSTWVQQTLGL
jgi:hypothetical protein